MLHTLANRIQSLDSELDGHGIYGSDLKTIWSKSLNLILKANGWKISDCKPDKFISIHNTNGKTGRIEIITTSTVKVRKYGDSFKIDSKANHRDVWDNKRLLRNIGQLKKDDDYHYRAFIFLGFDYCSTPFRKELNDLTQNTTWDSHGIEHYIDSWSDQTNNNLSIVTAVWERN